MKHLKRYVISTVVDDTTDTAVIHEKCKDLCYRTKEVVMTDDIMITILDIGKLCQSYSGNGIY